MKAVGLHTAFRYHDNPFGSILTEEDVERIKLMSCERVARHARRLPARMNVEFGTLGLEMRALSIMRRAMPQTFLSMGDMHFVDIHNNIQRDSFRVKTKWVDMVGGRIKLGEHTTEHPSRPAFMLQPKNNAVIVSPKIADIIRGGAK